MLNEMQENLSLVSFSSRLATQVWQTLSDFYFIGTSLCNIYA
jgi:cytoplasmic FMR1 interacting protein